MTTPTDMRARADLLEVLGDADSATMLRDAADLMDEQEHNLAILRAFPEPWTKAAEMGWKHESIGDYELSGPRDCQSGAAERMAHDAIDTASQHTAHAIDTIADLYGPDYALDLARFNRFK